MKLIAHHGLSYSHQLFHGDILLLFGLILVFGFRFHHNHCARYHFVEAICLGLFISPVYALKDFPIDPKSLIYYHISHPITPWCHSIVAFVPFLCLFKHLHYLHMENHTLGEALVFKFTLQPWAILDF